jgi:UDP-N-acetylglucosamine 1-carboxyvinyltransferase
MKRFLEWLGLKEKLHSVYRKPPLVSEGDIWWTSMGENIGREINGKNEKFSRPVLIFKKLSKELYVVIPFTSQQHTGSWYVPYKFGKKNMYACLHQVRSIDYRRFYTRLTQMGSEDFYQVQKGFASLYQKICPAISGEVAGNPESAESIPLPYYYTPPRQFSASGILGQLIPMDAQQKQNNFVVEGGHKLSGSIVTNRSKNGAVALLAASLLNKGVTTLHKVPKIEEVHRLVEVLVSIGVKAEWHDRDLVLTPPERISLETIDTVSAARTRSILMFIGPLLHHFNSFDIPQSGGCTLGLRSVRQHLWALESLGVSIETNSDHYHVTHDSLKANTVILYEASDTATINALLAASRIDGVTTIKYASANYQVQEICGFLKLLGVGLEGIGTTTLTVTGVPFSAAHASDISYTVAEDPTDAMFFIAAAVTTKSALTIERAPIEFLEVELNVLEKMNLKYSLKDAGVSENGITKLADIILEPSDLIAFPEKIHARPYPALNIDNLPFFAVMATQAEGITLIHDWSYEKRAIYYTELDRLGADTLLMDPHRIQIIGPSHLRGAELVCPPALRPATILLIGMLAADGTSTLRNIYSINRGYEDLVPRLQSIGAHIQATS